MADDRMFSSADFVTIRGGNVLRVLRKRFAQHSYTLRFRTLSGRRERISISLLVKREVRHYAFRAR